MGYEADDVRDIYDKYTDTSAVAAGGIGTKKKSKKKTHGSFFGVTLIDMDRIQTFASF